jgi:salicylate hydroxylase
MLKIYSPAAVIVVGAGLGGCAAALAMKHHGHDVIVYEKLTTFRRLGDSLGLGENALKLLRRWGGDTLYHALTSIGNQSQDMQIRRWQDGKVLAQQPLMDMAGYIGHRGDYHEAFLRGVRDAGIEIKVGYEVVGFGEGDEEDARPSIVFKDGTVARADVIVGADGIKSRARELVLGFNDAPKSSGYSCWRAYFPGEHLKSDPMCKDFVDHDCVNIWCVAHCHSHSPIPFPRWPQNLTFQRIGLDTHLVQNTLRDGEEFNWIITRKLTHEADMEIKESWYQEGDMDDVRKHIASLDPRIAAAVEKTPALLDWKICYRDPLPTWISKKHNIALLGDSCHPHLPTSAQGASQATESAAVLAVCLRLAGRDRIPLAVSFDASKHAQGRRQPN